MRDSRRKVHQPPDGRWTYEEYMKLPVEGTRYEVIAGELYITPFPPVRHQIAISKLLTRIFKADDELGLGFLFPGPVDVLFGEEDFIEPDCAFVRKDRQPIIKEHGIEGVPDLVIECVAPETAERDRGLKRERYAFCGVPEYWVFDADQRVLEVYRNRVAPGEPEVVRDRWVWQPVPDGPTLEFDLLEILDQYEEAKFLEPWLLRWRDSLERRAASPNSH